MQFIGYFLHIYATFLIEVSVSSKTSKVLGWSEYIRVIYINMNIIASDPDPHQTGEVCKWPICEGCNLKIVDVRAFR